MKKPSAIPALLLAGLLGPLLLLPSEARASAAGRRNTALILGGVAVYGALKKEPLIAVPAAAGAVYSYTRYRQAARRERDRYRYDGRYYDDRYRYGRWDRYDRRDPCDDRYDYRYGRYDYRYDRDDCCRDCDPPGWSRGRKTGWRGRGIPPGHYRRHCD